MGGSVRVPGLQLIAGGTIAPARVVKLDTGNDFTALQAGAGDQAIGISQLGQAGAPGVAGSDTTVAAAAGQMVDTIQQGNVAYASAGAAIATRDNWLKSDANGQVIVHTTGAAHCVGRNLTLAAGLGSIIKIWVNPSRVVLP